MRGFGRIAYSIKSDQQLAAERFCVHLDCFQEKGVKLKASSWVAAGSMRPCKAFES